MQPEQSSQNQQNETHQHFLKLNKTLSKLGQLSQLSFNNNNSNIFYYKNPIILNKQYQKDIQPGIYEGGFQLWQCQIEFIKKMFQSQSFYQIINNKHVIEIGCGHGLLAIAASKLGAKSIILQDYNQNVIQELTRPTIQINKVNIPVSYLSGDWNTMSYKQGYDIILGSQLTYRQQNYEKIINFIFNNMKPNGKCILANKAYYFGVGGNLVDFKQRLQEKGLLYKTISKIVPKSGGNKKQIIQISFKQVQ